MFSYHRRNFGACTVVATISFLTFCDLSSAFQAEERTFEIAQFGWEMERCILVLTVEVAKCTM